MLMNNGLTAQVIAKVNRIPVEFAVLAWCIQII